MKKILILLIIILGYTSVINASFKDEALHYVISYKWGLIHKDAGEATLSLRNHNGNYYLMLAAKTKPWADKIYQVRDTLKGIMRANDLRPIEYQKIAHEKDKYGTDIITYSYSGNKVTGLCKRFKNNGKGGITESTKELISTGPTFDMLSVFYYLRQLDYAQLQPGKKIEATIFSGSKMETISIKNVGKEKIKLKNGIYKEAYHVRFKFTTDGKKRSSDDINCWISTDSRHIPLYLIGKLPVGEVRAYIQ